MKHINPVIREVLLVSLGQLLTTGLMFGVFALGGFWSTKVLWGGLLGCGLSILYYGLAALGVSIASAKAIAQDVTGGKRILRISQLLRYALLALTLIMALRGDFVNIIALLIPLLMLRVVLSVCEFFRKAGDQNVH